MATPNLKKSPSAFSVVTSREINPFAVRRQPRYNGWNAGFYEIRGVGSRSDGHKVVPLAISFAKTSNLSYIIALANEEGYVTLFDTRLKSTDPESHKRSAEELKICQWSSHNNAVFDISWIKDDTQFLTASGDQTVKLWDVQENKCLGALTGHMGSVKSIGSHPTNSDIIVSGSRDGSFRLWDLRCKTDSKTRRGEASICSTAVVKGAHLPAQVPRARRGKGKAASMSITSVLWLKDDVSIATAGAVDSVLKFWDTRNLKGTITQTCPEPQSAGMQSLHGITSLSQDDTGVLLTASCMDSRIYLYNTLQLEKGPCRYFQGGRIESFFTKAAISPDASNLVCGSSDETAYIWEVNKPEEEPNILKSHYEEVTAVDWCRSEFGKLATASDDFTVRIWEKRNHIMMSKLPFAMRRRIKALPIREAKLMFYDEDTCPWEKKNGLLSSDESMKSATPSTPPEVTTSEGHNNQLSSEINLTISPKPTPESALKSPSSVLNPPPSLKRTIRDYFVAFS